MTDQRAAAIELAALKALKDEVDSRYKMARAAAARNFDVGDRKSAVLPDGSDIGTVSYVAGRSIPKVTNPAALLAWVKAVAPGEVESVERVRESYIAALISRADNVDGYVVDGKTGEVIPGLTVSDGEPYVKTAQTDTQRKEFVRAYVDGRLSESLGALLAYQPVIGEISVGAKAAVS